MNKLLLDYAITKKFKEIDEIAELIGCNEKSLDGLKNAIDSFVAKLSRETPVKFLIIKLLQILYNVDYQDLSKKTINELLYLVFLSQENIKKQYLLLKKADNTMILDESFNVILDIPVKDFNYLLKLFTLLGSIVKKSQIIQTKDLEEELSNWNKRKVSQYRSHYNGTYSNNKDNKSKQNSHSILLLLAASGTLGALLLYAILKSIFSK